MPHKITQTAKKLKVGVVCGGPSLERGISLNSARSLLDHLGSDTIHISAFYVDTQKNWYAIPTSQLYSNTPADFDHKLSQVATPLVGEALVEALKAVDIVFPAMHGAYGEDGELQAFLERMQVPFVGPDSVTAAKMFHKKKAADFIAQHGFKTLESLELFRADENDWPAQIRTFFSHHQNQRIVVKPTEGGSSIGVSVVATPEAALEKTHKLFLDTGASSVLLEPFCVGKEFTIIVMESHTGTPVALIPNAIEISYEGGQIFDYRRKYLPTSNTKWPCPPPFSDALVEEIQQKAENLFTLFEMRDFARLDGWILESGDVVFTDFNPISGMEQNSFCFQQAARVGLTHQGFLRYVLETACRRTNIPMPFEPEDNGDHAKHPVWVLFGGENAERQVSLMSGTNVWLKLRQSRHFNPQPFFLDIKGHVWHLPYMYALSHTVEEVYENCATAHATRGRLLAYANTIRARLGLDAEPFNVAPRSMGLESFMACAQKEGAFVFIALHGGEGEDGSLQAKLARYAISHNGSGAEASQLCMDKYLTGHAIDCMGNAQISSLPKFPVHPKSMKGKPLGYFETIWQQMLMVIGTPKCIIKPQNDGCSAGVVRLQSPRELKQYVDLLNQEVAYIDAGIFQGQEAIIELSTQNVTDYIIEPFIPTDVLTIDQKGTVNRAGKEGWIELTCGVLASNGHYHALNPSITIAGNSVLSVEEKFQGGTGVNLTPPPEHIISKGGVQEIQAHVERVAEALGIDNYARIDLFYNTNTKKVVIIEANTLPALTPSTVIYHQALAEETPMAPTHFLESLIFAALGHQSNTAIEEGS